MMAQEKQVDRDLRIMARSKEVCRRFMGIPGVGPICTLTFYAAVSEPYRFRRSADVGCYLGLTPRIYQSGLTRRVGRISKMGNKDARSLLVTASTRFMTHSPRDVAIYAWAKGVELRRGKFKSRVALARKLAGVMLAMWKSGEPYRPLPAALDASGLWKLRDLVEFSMLRDPSRKAWLSTEGRNSAELEERTRTQSHSLLLKHGWFDGAGCVSFWRTGTSQASNRHISV